MNAHETQSLNAINRAIAELEKTRDAVLARIPLSSRLKKGQWVINKHTNTHYQFQELSKLFDSEVVLKRFGSLKQLSVYTFNKEYIAATQEQVENHLRYLNNKGLVYDGESRAQERLNELFNETKPKVQLPEFYLITVEGKSGAIVRHADFQTAVTEATRLAKKANHRAHIMGVCAIVEPVQVQQPIIEYQLIKK